MGPVVNLSVERPCMKSFKRSNEMAFAFVSRPTITLPTKLYTWSWALELTGILKEAHA